MNTMDAMREAILKERGLAVARAAIGAEMTIRETPNMTTTGKIIEASVAYLKRSRRSTSVVFRVVLECGTTKYQRAFNVSKLPRARR